MKYVSQQKKWQDRKRAEGLCPKCGGQPKPGYVCCPKCCAAAAKLYRKNKRKSA